MLMNGVEGVKYLPSDHHTFEYCSHDLVTCSLQCILDFWSVLIIFVVFLLTICTPFPQIKWNRFSRTQRGDTLLACGICYRHPRWVRWILNVAFMRWTSSSSSRSRFVGFVCFVPLHRPLRVFCAFFLQGWFTCVLLVNSNSWWRFHQVDISVYTTNSHLCRISNRCNRTREGYLHFSHTVPSMP